jgi:PAS domain S-box-containing protein
MEFFRQLFGSGDFMPHGYCYLWNSGLIWLHVISDSLIAMAYFAIPVTLIWFVRKRGDLPFSWIFILFGIFIIACGATHLMEIWNLWHASYWLAGTVKAVTAAASVATAILLVPLVPKALQLASPDQWIRSNEVLKKEIIERNELELNLRISESGFRDQAELLELTHDAIIVRNLEAKILCWNRGAERMYGWQKEEARGKLVHSLLQTEFPVPLAEIEKQMLDNGYWEGELLHRRRDGAILNVSSRWSLRTDIRGNPLSFLEINRDITERKKEAEKFRDLLESAPDAMVIVNHEGRITLTNAQTEKLFGYPRQEILGQPVEILVPHRFRGRHPGHRTDFFRAPRARSMGAGLDLFGRRKDGTEFPVEISLSPLKTDEGMLVSSAIRDVTERRLAEDALKRNRAELLRSNAELLAANKELDTFSYSVSHDLRAPLRHIDGFARILQEERSVELSVEGRRYLDRILDAANHMGHLVDDLLSLARIGRKELVRQKTNIDEVVRQAITDLPPEAAQREIEWHIEPLPEMYCDPGLLRLVFSNLLANAVKFTRPRQAAVIQVGTRESEGIITLFVRDNGVGFDLKYADKLFGVFQRFHRQEDFEGTGVGLATSQRIIHRHGGEIRAESQPDQGTTFFFTLGPQVGLPVPDIAKEVKLD